MRFSPLVVLSLALVSCAWKNAQNQNDIEGYRSFLEAHPTHAHVAEAKLALEELEWQRASQGKDQETLRRFLADFPRSSHRDDALARIDVLKLEQAKRDCDLVALRPMAVADPQGEAAQILDECYWAQALEQDTSRAFHAYLQFSPAGRYRQEAEEARARVAWDEARLRDKIRDYQEYLRMYPNGPYATEAQGRLSRLLFDTVDVRIELVNGQGSTTAYTEAFRTAWVPNLERLGYRVTVAAASTPSAQAQQHAYDRIPAKPGVGLVVVQVEETGSGAGARAEAEVALYGAASRQPVLNQHLTGQAAANHTAAQSLAEALARVDFPPRVR